MDLIIAIKITFSATFPLKVLHITFQFYSKSLNKHTVIMDMITKMTTVMMTMKKYQNVRENQRSGYCYVASIKTMMTPSHKEPNLMKTCSLTGQKRPEQCLLPYYANLLTGLPKRRNEALEDPSVLKRRQQQTVDPARLNRQQMLAYNILASHHAALNSATPPRTTTSQHYRNSRIR